MSVEKVGRMIRTLEGHEAAFKARSGFGDLQDRAPAYLGRGRTVVLPDGRNYGIYAKGWTRKSGETLLLTFIGQSAANATGSTEIGNARLSFSNADGTLSLDGANVNDARVKHAYPDVSELARPLGAWLTESLGGILSRRDENRQIQRGRCERLDELTAKVRSMPYGSAVDEAQLFTDFAAIILDSRKVRPESEHVSHQDVAELEEFVYGPANVTAGIKLVAGETPGIIQKLVEVEGPLLGLGAVGI